MEPKEVPKALDIGAPQDVLLKELGAKIHASIVANVTRSELFEIFMNWLNEKIKQDVITQSNHLLRGFVKLLQLRDYAEVTPFNLTQVDEAFSGWLEKDAVQDPTYRRRYLITQQDVHRLFADEEQKLQTPGDSYSPAFLCKQEDKRVRAGNKTTDLQQRMGYAMHLNTTAHSAFPVGLEITRDGRPEQQNFSMNADAVLSRGLNDTYLQDANANDVTLKQETILTDASSEAKMARKSSKFPYRSRKVKLDGDSYASGLPPAPKGYICKRCCKPGHWIQHCPTNLDPHYDRAPAHGYRCNFCGQQGNHFTTLCPNNPHDGSLFKQREHAKAELYEPRTPTKNGECRYEENESLTTHSQSRNRSCSPNPRYRDNYRSRSPEYSRLHQERDNCCGAQPRKEDAELKVQLEDKSEVSPYTRRARLTQEYAMSLVTTEAEKPSIQPWTDRVRLETRLTPPPRRRRSSFVKKRRRRHRRDLDNVPETTNEGRLAYDDEVNGPASAGLSLSSPPSNHPQNINASSIVGDETTRLELSCMTTTPREINKVQELAGDEAQQMAEDFLYTLATELILRSEYTTHTEAVTADPIEAGIDSCHMTEGVIDRSSQSDVAGELERLPEQSISDLNHRPVQCPPFSPRVVSLFRTQTTPIIHVGANRMTASHMMSKSEHFCARRGEEPDAVPNFRLPLPCCSSSAGVDDGI
ncbi:putative nuclear protein [Rosellinia necatrix]|uniref:Putative nuclear protein n=1 Tax=Rosellinia necatrix TaxID=77044 RepID=A0A1W2TB78_ROSNE|nr:putative nuclear protein [Rosellinia necatrix]